MSQPKRYALNGPPGHAAVMVKEKGNLFIEFDGEKIAKRVQPGTVWAGMWLTMKPGYEVIDQDKLNVITVIFSDGETVPIAD